MGKRPKILVVGSFVMDLIVSAHKFPKAGESVIGCGFSTAPGGKGANQAIQAARLGADVVMAGRVGDDDFGKKLISSMRDGGVNIDMVYTTKDTPTAVGNIQLQVTESGTENRIIVVPGANMCITEADVMPLKEKIADFDMVILQNEIPGFINELVAGYAHEKNIPVMLNPAPYGKLSEKLLSCITYISPNEHEAEEIIGQAVTDDNLSDAVACLRKLGVKNALITLGKNGAVFGDGDKIIHSICENCGYVCDPTAAGDSFIGAFCTAVASGADVETALKFANCTAGITVTRMGAQPSLPKLDEVLNIMQQKEYDTSSFSVLRGE